MCFATHQPSVLSSTLKPRFHVSFGLYTAFCVLSQAEYLEIVSLDMTQDVPTCIVAMHVAHRAFTCAASAANIWSAYSVWIVPHADCINEHVGLIACRLQGCLCTVKCTGVWQTGCYDLCTGFAADSQAVPETSVGGSP